MRPAQQIIKRPLLTEKSARMRETGGAAVAPAEGDKYQQKLTFVVADDANKIEVKQAIEKLFKVKVTSVRTMVVRGKEKRLGRFSGQRAGWKKAFVTLAAGESIEFFQGV